MNARATLSIDRTVKEMAELYTFLGPSIFLWISNVKGLIVLERYMGE
jgi:hypothetical protein